MSKTQTLAGIDELMYSCGVEILHPGGIEKTDEMARACHVGRDKKILDVGSGKGVTACYLAEKYGANVTGVDLSDRMIDYARKAASKKKLGAKVSFQRADATALPFSDESFDILLAECTTTLLDKERAFSEFLRVVRPGGYIGDLEMTWQKSPPLEAVEKAYQMWEGYTTMTLEEWKDFYKSRGIIDVEAQDFSEKIADMRAVTARELGITGQIKMCFKLLSRSDLRQAMKEYVKFSKQYADFIGCGYIVGRRRP